MNISQIRTRWAAVGAAIAITLGAGGIGITHATTSSGEKAVYLPMEPCRLADLRPAPFQVGPRPAALGAAETYTLSGWGSVGDCTLPTGTTALALNVTAVGATQDTFLTFFPASATRPNASNLNPAPGQPPTPNAVNVDLDGAGEFSVYNLQGNVNVIIDVVGVYDDHNHDDRYYTKTQIDARPHTMFAVVNNSSAIVRQSGGVTIASHSTGQNYWLTFPENVTQCAFSATLGGPGVLDNAVPVLNHLGIAATQGTQGFFEVDVDEVAVSVYEQDTGDIVDNAFSVVVTCP